MDRIKRLFTHNWFEKLFALLLAIMLWMTIASDTSSEIGLEVPLEFRNIPPQMEIRGDTVNSVEVRLRGSSNRIKEISGRDISTMIDLGAMKAGEKTILLSAANIQAPFGVEVVRVNPSRVKLTLEKTVSKLVPITANIQGRPAAGYETGRVLLNPAAVEVQGPESSVAPLESALTIPISIEGKSSDLQQNLDLDVPDPSVRLMVATVQIHVEIVKEKAH